MKNRLIKLFVLMVFSLSIMVPVFASTVRELTWDDLQYPLLSVEYLGNEKY